MREKLPAQGQTTSRAHSPPPRASSERMIRPTKDAAMLSAALRMRRWIALASVTEVPIVAGSETEERFLSSQSREVDCCASESKALLVENSARRPTTCAGKYERLRERFNEQRRRTTVQSSPSLSGISVEKHKNDF